METTKHTTTFTHSRMNKIASPWLLLFCAGLASLSGPDVVKADDLRARLNSVPIMELPSTAAAIVKQANVAERQVMTVATVKAVLDINPAIAPPLIDAISRAVPDVAPVAAATASEKQPKQAALIARSAAAAAPAQAVKIVLAACRAVPGEYRNIAASVAEVTPALSKGILEAVAAAIPSLKPSIEQALKADSGGTPVVSVVLDQAKVFAEANSKSAITITLSAPSSPVVVRPPYIPLSDTPANSSPATDGEVPAGGRNVAAP